MAENGVRGSSQEGINNFNSSAKNIANTELKDIAVKQIKSKNPVVAQLIDFLVKVNAHAILQATGGQIQYDTSSATFKTTQGVVIPFQVIRARNLLSNLYDKVKKSDWSGSLFEDNLNEYLSLIPRDFGMKRHGRDEISGDDAEVNRDIIVRVMKGVRGAKRDIIVINSAAAIAASGKTESIKDGIELAEESIDSGKAGKKLNEMIEFTNNPNSMGSNLHCWHFSTHKKEKPIINTIGQAMSWPIF